MTYRGVAIDGPKRGQSIEHQSPCFPVPIYRSIGMVDFGKAFYEPIAQCEITRAFYRWSHSLSQWCLEY